MAKNDVIIGYHFRHILDFDTHIPKIQRFWYLILLKPNSEDKKLILSNGVPKDIIHSHEYLKIKKGEVGRWIVLFDSILDKYADKNKNLTDNWRLEIKKFEKIFLKADKLYL